MALVMAVALAVVPVALGHPYDMPLGKGKTAIRHAVHRIAEREGAESWGISGCSRVPHSRVRCWGHWRLPRICSQKMIAYYPNSSQRIKVYASGPPHCSR
jgi:hypothetical protein